MTLFFLTSCDFLENSLYVSWTLFLTGAAYTGIAAFEMEYSLWVEEQQKKNVELRNILQSHVTEMELQLLVETVLNHYYNLFRMKADAAKADVFYLMSGMWRSSVERFFLWIGGFKPSELINVGSPCCIFTALWRSNIHLLSSSSHHTYIHKYRGILPIYV